jgi:DNA-binding XRE family transcriptional regulator
LFIDLITAKLEYHTSKNLSRKNGGDCLGFSKNLARMQEERGVTNYKIAKALGISQTTIQNWKDGKSKPRSLYLTALMRYFGCTLDDLTGGE